MMSLGIGVLVTLLTTAVILRLVERHAPALGLMDVPNPRSSHSRPTPRGGGIGIVAGAVLGILVTLAVGGSSDAATAAVVLTAAAGVALVSLVDDLRELPPLVRLMAHVVAAAWVVASFPLPTVLELPLLAPIPLGAVAPVLAVLWVVGVTNVYNFMDGIDGLAGGQGLVAGATWGVVGLLAGDRFVAACGIAIAAACAIFLARNWAPARIFMGDAGSAFLGFLLAVLPLLVVGAPPGSRSWALGALVLWPFLFDTTLTLFRRAVRGENVLQAHRSHLYQRLVVSGATHAAVSRLYVLLAAAAALIGVGWALGQLRGWAVVGVTSVEVVMLVLLVRRRER